MFDPTPRAFHQSTGDLRGISADHDMARLRGQSVAVDGSTPAAVQRLTLFQRAALRRLRRRARRGRTEPLSPEDWEAVYALGDSTTARAIKRVWRTLPSSPRCGMCSAPFGSPGRFVAGPLGYRPSRKNPTLCATCVELSPPGGMQLYTGVLFADLRGFTARAEAADPREVADLLRRFYGCAERVLFPEAIIDKVVGDQVMALYLPDLQRNLDRAQLPSLMVDHALGVLRGVGYGAPEGPFVDVGVGLDIGDAFVGNIGERAVYDFTAVGDVVNTAARLQGEAKGGEIVFSERIAHGLPTPLGTPCELRLKGKQHPQHCFRLTITNRS